MNEQKNEDSVCFIVMFGMPFICLWPLMLVHHMFPLSCFLSRFCRFCIHVVALEEEDYIPLVKEFISLQKEFEKPFGAGTAIARQQNKKPSTSKPKAKGKAKAKASA